MAQTDNESIEQSATTTRNEPPPTDNKMQMELMLTQWLNKYLAPASYVLAPNEWNSSEAWDELITKVDTIKHRLSDKISWIKYFPIFGSLPNKRNAIYVTSHHESIELKNKLESLLANYNSLWLNLAIMYLKKVTKFNRKHQAVDGHQETISKLFELADPELHSNPSVALCIHFLTVVYLMDQAKTRQMLTKCPCLFAVTPVDKQMCSTQSSIMTVNSSKQILNQFILQCLSPGLGNQFRMELKSIDYDVGHLDNANVISFQFKVNQLSQDLRDGIRLSRLCEIMFNCSNGHLLDRLRYPANKTVGSLRDDLCAHNVNILCDFIADKLKLYESKGYGQQCRDPESLAAWKWFIAHGHRNPTLHLVQALMSIEFKIKIERDYRPHLEKIVFLQQKWKALILGRRARKEYLRLKQAATFIQARYRQIIAAKQIRNRYVQLKKASILVQKRYRLKKNLAQLRTIVELNIKIKDRACITIQRYWRGEMVRRAVYEPNPWLVNTAINIHLLSKDNQPQLKTIRSKYFEVVARMQNRYSKCKDHTIGDFRRELGVNSTLRDMIDLYRYTYYCQTLMDNLNSSKQWVFTFLCQTMYNLNRSEQHKTTGYYVLALVQNSLERQVKLLADTNDSRSTTTSARLQMAKALIHLMNNYFNYAVLVHQALVCLRCLVRLSPSLVDHLIEDKKWSRILTRLKKKYSLESGKLNTACDCNSWKLTESEADGPPSKSSTSLDHAKSTCFCTLIPSELLHFNEYMQI